MKISVVSERKLFWIHVISGAYVYRVGGVGNRAERKNRPKI
jgi:hypothetical protein